MRKKRAISYFNAFCMKESQVKINRKLKRNGMLNSMVTNRSTILRFQLLFNAAEHSRTNHYLFDQHNEKGLVF